MSLDRPIFLLGAHKSGTSLLRSLFDGHPDLFVVPYETHLLRSLGYKVNIGYSGARGGECTAEAFIQRVTADVKHQNWAEDSYADAVNKGLFDEATFSSVLKAKNLLTEQDRIESLFRAIHASYRYATKGVMGRVVEKSVSHAEHAARLKDLFPDAIFVQLIRDPYANWLALRKYKSKQFSAPLIAKMVKTFTVNYKSLLSNEKHLSNYMVIRYEDLVLQPEEVMKKVADHCQISFNPCLLQPSKGGSIWTGNSTSNQHFDGVSAERLEKRKNEIHPTDVHYVNLLYRKVVSHYGYTLQSPTGSFFQRYPSERLGRYAANRFFRFFAKRYQVE